MNRMDRLKSSLTRCLRARAEKAELNWSDFSKHTIEVVIFGSRSIGMNHQDSDLDVLVVGGDARRMKRGGLDLVFISISDLASPTWLGSELAGHVSTYGVWMKGHGDWRRKVTVGPEAWRQKQQRLISLMRSVKHSWTQLHPLFKSKYRMTIRRELQRLLLLRAAVPIPPTPLLDSKWKSSRVEARASLQAFEFIDNETKSFTLGNVLD
jgi:hypothetical protein